MMKYGFILRNLSKAFVVTTLIILGLGFLFILCRLGGNCSNCPKCFKINFFFIFLFTILNLVITFAYYLITRNVRKYLQLFSSSCQVDLMDPSLNFKNSKTSPLEFQHYNDLWYPYRVSAFLALVEFGAFIFLSIYIFVLCCEKKTSVSSGTVNVYANRMATNNFENAEMGNAVGFNEVVDDNDFKKNQI